MDIADTRVVLQDKKKPENILYETTLPYFKRSLEIDIGTNLTRQIQKGRTEYQICLLATDSKTFVRGLYNQQCKPIPRNLKSAAAKTGSNYVLMTAGLFVLVRTLL